LLPLHHPPLHLLLHFMAKALHSSTTLPNHHLLCLFIVTINLSLSTSIQVCHDLTSLITIDKLHIDISILQKLLHILGQTGKRPCTRGFRIDMLSASDDVEINLLPFMLTLNNHLDRQLEVVAMKLWLQNVALGNSRENMTEFILRSSYSMTWSVRGLKNNIKEKSWKRYITRKWHKNIVRESMLHS
jgi:hypothetical protein